MSVFYVLRRAGDVMVLAGLGLCSAAIIMMVAFPAYAQQAQKENLREQANSQSENALEPWLGGNWQIGAFGEVSSNPYRGADSADFGALPALAYDAERLHIGLDGIDAKVWMNDFASVSVIGDIRMEPFDPGDSSYLNGLEKRDMAFEAGIGGSLRLWRGELQANYLADLSDAHSGHEVDVGYYLPTSYGKFQFDFGGGVTWQSDDLVDYNVGVRRNEVRSDRRFYAPDAAFIPHLDFSVTYPVTENFAVMGTTGVLFLPDEYTDSPIIDDDYVVSAGLALVYTF